MKLKNKIGLAIIFIIAILSIGTCVHAAEFTSRVLINNLANMKLTSFTSGNTTTTSSKNPNENYDFENGVSLTRQQIISSKNLFCAKRNQELAKRATFTYDPESKERYETKNTKLAYILSEPENDRTTFANGKVQQALWYYLANDALIEQGETERTDLYEAACKFEDYRKNYKDPTLDSSKQGVTANTNGGYDIGPYKLTYTTEFYNNPETGYSVSFGEIKEASLLNSKRREYNRLVFRKFTKTKN